MAVLNLFPSRVAFTNPDGTLTAEAYRTLQVLFSRVGGALGDSGTDVFGQLFGAPTDSANNLSNALSDVVQPASTDVAYSDTVQPVSFGTDFYGDVVQYQASSKDIAGAVFPDVMQPASKDREAGIFTTFDVSGNASIGGTLKLAAGTVSLPSLYWSTDTTTGFYRIGANNNGYAVSGVKVLDFTATGLTISPVSGALIFSGAVSGQVIANNADLYLDAAAGKVINIRPNGSATAGIFSSTGLTVTGTSRATGGGAINGKAAVVNVAAPTAAGATYTATEQALINDIRTRLINFGIYT
jgi:hypothetical protein